MKIIKKYLLLSFLPILTLIITGLILKPNNCSQCVLLILTGSFLALLYLLILNSVLFLNLINLKDKLKSEILILATFFSTPLISTFFVFNIYYKANEKLNSDFKILLPSLILTFILAFKFSNEIIKETKSQF
jgi:hypothetical protein